ncbi:MAG: alpha/beta hydrolase [Bacteroidota bacterium]
MKKSFFLAILAIFIVMPFIGKGQSEPNFAKLNGAWEGILVAEGDSQCIVIEVVADTSLKSTVSLPWTGMASFIASKTTLVNDTFYFKVSQPTFSFKGVYDEKSQSIKGLFKQGKSYPLELQKTDHPQRINRPQTPIAPYPYISEDVEFSNSKQNIKFGGTLTIPIGDGPFPAVVLISGSGPQNRDEELLGHKPFLVISDYLTRNGIAVLRYDDRGVGKSTGKFSEGTTLDFANDAESAFNFLSTDKRIYANKIGLVGHSEGGVIAPIVASREKKVAFIILLAGTGVDGKILMLEQYRLILKASGIPDSIVTPLVDLNRQAFDIALTTKDNKKAAEKIRVVTNNIIQQIGVETAKKYNLTPMSAEKLIMQILTPWMKEFMRLNPAEYLCKVNCPILALNGDLDLQVPAILNIPAIQKAVAKNKKGKLTVKTFPKLNHLFQTSTTGSPSEYARIEETLNEEVLKVMLEYIQKLP